MICINCHKEWSTKESGLGAPCPFCGYSMFSASKKQDTSKEKEAEKKRLKALCTQSKFEQSLENEDPSALCTLGFYYSSGLKDYPKDPEKAFESFERSAKGGHGMGQCNLGICYAQGLGTTVNLGKAFYWYEQSAKSGEPRGFCEEGTCYMYGKGVVEDREKGYALLQTAGEKGYLRAYYYLAHHTYDGRGTQADATQAYEYLKLALPTGDSDVAYSYAMQNLRGRGIPTNYKLALKWLHTAAEKQVPDALHQLAQCHWDGFGMKQNLEEAKKYLEEAMALGHDSSESALENLALEQENHIPTLEEAVKQKKPYAYYLLGKAYMSSSHPDKQKRAREVLDIATNYHIPKAYYLLGCCYRDGIGGEVSGYKAAKAFRHGQQEQDLHASCALACCLQAYPEDPEHLEQAIDLLKEGAELGHSDSQYVLAQSFLQGTGVLPSRKLAMIWFKRAKESGSEQAAQWLDDYYNNN